MSEEHRRPTGEDDRATLRWQHRVRTIQVAAVAVAALATLTSCKSMFMGPCADAASDMRGKNLDLSGSDNAAVYVVRPFSFAGAAVTPSIDVNNADIGSIGPGHYVYAEVPSGQCVIRTARSNLPVADDEVQVDAKPGAKYYWRIGFGWQKVLLKEIDAKKGERALRKCKLTGDSDPQSALREAGRKLLPARDRREIRMPPPQGHVPSRIAVWDLTPLKGVSPDFTAPVTETLRGVLLNSKWFRVVARSEMAKVTKGTGVLWWCGVPALVALCNPSAGGDL